MKKLKSLNNILLNSFRNFKTKTIKFGDKYPNWMNLKIISFRRSKFKLTKRYYCDPTEEIENLLSSKSNEC